MTIYPKNLSIYPGSKIAWKTRRWKCLPSWNHWRKKWRRKWREMVTSACAQMELNPPSCVAEANPWKSGLLCGYHCCSCVEAKSDFKNEWSFRSVKALLCQKVWDSYRSDYECSYLSLRRNTPKDKKRSDFCLVFYCRLDWKISYFISK